MESKYACIKFEGFKLIETVYQIWVLLLLIELEAFLLIEIVYVMHIEFDTQVYIEFDDSCVYQI